MKIAIFSDIHGNLFALQAVLDDIRERGVDMVFCGGDLVGYGAHPNEVISLIRQHQIPTIMGNYDQGIGNDSDDCGCAYRDELSKALGKRSIAWTKEKVTPENKACLRNLPERLSLTINGKKILMVHGSPRKINEYLFEDRPVGSVVRFFEGEKVDIITCGHTHLPYVRQMIIEEGLETVTGPDGQPTSRLKPGGIYILVNSGSVGEPKDGDLRAGYALLDFMDGGIKYEIVRVPYEVEAAARAVEQSGLPVEYADMLRRASG
ncbi:MAG: metallophosphatase family protein [Candidatus Saccharicenans sp.]|jgi:predicted phosphodiesterase|nr:metallophosphatase family protein [Candidatus Saccharicenans sp.]MDH7492663.1 metallophosphoesterase family protein [Candidatus Saccharicenans sp.]